MTDKEEEALLGFFEHATNYLEWGSGGSTYRACKYKKMRITSVESDAEYVTMLTDEDSIKAAQSENRLDFILINIGETKEWGHPVDDSKKHLYSHYSMAPFTRSEKYDLVLVDGRFRLACVIIAALENEDAVILVHDYTLRSSYWAIEKWFTVEVVADTLVRVKINKSTTPKDLRNLYKNYCDKPDDRRYENDLYNKILKLKYSKKILALRSAAKNSNYNKRG